MLDPMPNDEIDRFWAPPVLNPESEKAIVGIFADRPDAESAVAELEAAGFTADHIGFVVRDARPEDAIAADAQTPARRIGSRAESMADGAIAGGIIGGVLATAVSILIPPIGPIIVGGVLASFFGGTLAGMAVGGVIGALDSMGFSEQQAREFQAEFEAGRAIVAVRAGVRTAEATAILSRYGAVGIHSPLSKDDVSAEFHRPTV